jgi:hypothetical protein
MTKHLIAAAFTAGIVWAASSTPVKADGLYVNVETAPRRIESYPHTVYEGRPVYYYDGRWYSRRGPGWVYYRDEPRPLVEYRSRPSRHNRDYDRHEHRARHERHERHEHHHDHRR